MPPLLLVVVAFSGKAWWLLGVTEFGAIHDRVVDISAMLLETLTITGSVALLWLKGRAYIPVLFFYLIATLYLATMWARSEEPDCTCFGALQAYVQLGDSVRAGIARNLIALSMLGVSSLFFSAARATSSVRAHDTQVPANARPA